MFYATRGALKVESKNSPILPAWFRAAEELGYSVSDPNGNQTESKHINEHILDFKSEK